MLFNIIVKLYIYRIKVLYSLLCFYCILAIYCPSGKHCTDPSDIEMDINGTVKLQTLKSTLDLGHLSAANLYLLDPQLLPGKAEKSPTSSCSGQKLCVELNSTGTFLPVFMVNHSKSSIARTMSG